MRRQLPAWAWAAVTIACVFVLGWVDLVTGYELHFFVFYFLPVMVAAWFVGVEFTMSLAVFSCLVWYGADFLSGNTYSSAFYAVWNTVVRLVAFLAIGWSVSRMRLARDRERETAAALRKVLSEIRVLEAILPICSDCKKIRNDKGEWQQLEAYIGQHGGARFSHGYCPECFRKVMDAAGLKNPGE